MAKAGIWSRIVDRVLRRPAIIGRVSARACWWRSRCRRSGCTPRCRASTALPRSIPEMQTYDRIQAAFPGENIPAEVVVQGQGRDERARTARGDRRPAEAGRRTSGDLFEPGSTVEVSPDKTVASVNIPIAGDGTDTKSHDALDALRGDIIPATVGKVAGRERRT